MGLIGHSYFMSIQSPYRYNIWQFGYEDIESCADEVTDFAEYKARSIVLGKDIEGIQGTNSEKATAIDIDENGGLMIEKQDGTITSLHSGEISIRGNFASWKKNQNLLYTLLFYAHCLQL